MRWRVLAVLLAVCAAAAAASACGGSRANAGRGLPLRKVDEVPLGGTSSRLDSASVDPVRRLLYVSHLGAGRVHVVDLERRRLRGSVRGLRLVHGVLAVPQRGRTFAAAAGAGQVVGIDARTLRVVARGAAGNHPDSLAYDARAALVVAADARSHALMAFAAGTGVRATTILLDGDAGDVAWDAGSGLTLVAVRSRGALAAVDARRARVVRRAVLAGCEHPQPLAVAPRRRLALVGCQGNSRLVAVDLRTFRVVANVAVGDRPDTIAFDAGLGRAYVACEDGFVYAFGLGRRSLAKLGGSQVGGSAHVVAVDPTTHLVYLPLERPDDAPVVRVLEPTRLP